MELSLVVDVAGWLGALSLLMAYGMVSTGRVRGESMAYQAPNAVGSALLIGNTVFYGAYPSAFVNVVWIGIAFYALARRR